MEYGPTSAADDTPNRMISKNGGAPGPTTGEERRFAADLMEPLPARLALHHSVAAAHELMAACRMSFMVVVAPATGKLLGVVLRRTLERRCEARGHDPEACPLVRHVRTDIDFCLEDEPVEEVFGRHPTKISPLRGSDATPDARRRNAIPVIVVDVDKVPVGLLRRPRPTAPSRGRS